MSNVVIDHITSKVRSAQYVAPSYGSFYVAVFGVVAIGMILRFGGSSNAIITGATNAIKMLLDGLTASPISNNKLSGGQTTGSGSSGSY